MGEVDLVSRTVVSALGPYVFRRMFNFEWLMGGKDNGEICELDGMEDRDDDIE